MTIAHRLDTIIDYDQVVIMDKGKVVEAGPPHELRNKKGGKFASMWNDYTAKAGAPRTKGNSTS